MCILKDFLFHVFYCLRIRPKCTMPPPRGQKLLTNQVEVLFGSCLLYGPSFSTFSLGNDQFLKNKCIPRFDESLTFSRLCLTITRKTENSPNYFISLVSEFSFRIRISDTSRVANSDHWKINHYLVAINYGAHNLDLKNHRYSKVTKNHWNKFGPLILKNHYLVIGN